MECKGGVIAKLWNRRMAYNGPEWLNRHDGMWLQWEWREGGNGGNGENGTGRTVEWCIGYMYRIHLIYLWYTRMTTTTTTPTPTPTPTPTL